MIFIKKTIKYKVKVIYNSKTYIKKATDQFSGLYYLVS